jgi:hypothetical protein
LKQRRFIILKTKRLQQIRDNFRKIISLRVSDEMHSIFDTWIHLPKDQENYKFRLMDREYFLGEALRKSIVKCYICETTHDDRVYNAYAQEWICPNCFILLESLYNEVRTKKERGEHIGDHEEELDYYASFFK